MGELSLFLPMMSVFYSWILPTIGVFTALLPIIADFFHPDLEHKHRPVMPVSYVLPQLPHNV